MQIPDVEETDTIPTAESWQSETTQPEQDNTAEPVIKTDVVVCRSINPPSALRSRDLPPNPQKSS